MGEKQYGMKLLEAPPCSPDLCLVTLWSSQCSDRAFSAGASVLPRFCSPSSSLNPASSTLSREEEAAHCPVAVPSRRGDGQRLWCFPVLCCILRGSPRAAESAASCSSTRPQRISLLPWHCIPSSACTVMLPRLGSEQSALVTAPAGSDFSPPVLFPEEQR